LTVHREMHSEGSRASRDSRGRLNLFQLKRQSGEGNRNEEVVERRCRKVVFTSADKFPRWEIERTGNGLKKTREPQRLSEQWRGNPEKSKGYSKLEATRELELSPAHIHDQRRGNGVRQKPVGRKSEKNSELRSKGARRPAPKQCERQTRTDQRRWARSAKRSPPGPWHAPRVRPEAAG
jgi:hypothetical protein